MAKDNIIYRLCPICDGDGVVTASSPDPPHAVEDKPCPECLGENAKYPKAGGIFWGWTEKGTV